MNGEDRSVRTVNKSPPRAYKEDLTVLKDLNKSP